MNDKKIGILTLGAIVVLSAVICVLFIDITTEWKEKDEYCELNGYQRASSYSIKTFDGKEYIECYKEEIRFGKLLEIEDWLMWFGGEDK